MAYKGCFAPDSGLEIFGFEVRMEAKKNKREKEQSKKQSHPAIEGDLFWGALKNVKMATKTDAMRYLCKKTN